MIDPLDDNPVFLSQLGDDDDTVDDELVDLIKETGEGSVSGSTPATTSDDDTLQNMHDVGLQLNEDPDNPKPLNIAEQFAQAEKDHWNK